MRGFTRISLIWLLLLFLFIPHLSTPISANNINSKYASLNDSGNINSTISAQDINVTSAVLLFKNGNEIEFGGKLDISFGFLNDSSKFVPGVPYLLYLFKGTPAVTNFTLAWENSTLLLNSTSQSQLEDYQIDTLPANNPLTPNNYTLFLTSNFNATKNVNTTQVFRVFPHEGANIEISFFDYPTLFKITEPTNVDINETRIIFATLTNLGEGNALDVYFDIESINGPLEYNSIWTPYTAVVFPRLTTVRLNFTIKPPDFGISEVTFRLTYNNTLGRTLRLTKSIIFHTLPEFTGRINEPDTFVIGETSEIRVSISNFENVSFLAQIRLTSSKLTFTPFQTQIVTIEPGENKFSFNAISFANGTFTIFLILTYIDPNENDHLDITLDASKISVIEQPVQGQKIPLEWVIYTVAVILVILLLFIGVLYFRKDVRKIFVNKLTKSVMVPDIDYHNNKVIIDGSNVAWEELTKNGRPKISNIDKAIETLKNYGFKEIIVVADAALRYQIEDPKDLDNAVKKGIVKVLPAKVDGDGFILRLSRDLDALVLTNDLYKEYREEFPWIDHRRIPYSIINGTFYLHPIYQLEEDDLEH